jgi:hypothetical protein
MLSSKLVQIRIKYYINCFMFYFLPTTQKVEKFTEFISESIPKFISIILEKNMMHLRFTFYESLEVEC